MYVYYVYLWISENYELIAANNIMFVINEARMVTWIMSRKLFLYPLEITFRVRRHGGGGGEWIRSFRKHWLDLVFLNHRDIIVTHDKEHIPGVKSREQKKVLAVKWFISSTLQNKSRSFCKNSNNIFSTIWMFYCMDEKQWFLLSLWKVYHMCENRQRKWAR